MGAISVVASGFLKLRQDEMKRNALDPFVSPHGWNRTRTFVLVCLASMDRRCHWFLALV